MAAKHNRLIGFSVEENKLIEGAAAMSGVSVSRFVRDYAVWAARLKVTGGQSATGERMRELLLEHAAEGDRRRAMRGEVMLRAARRLHEVQLELEEYAGAWTLNEDEQGGT